MVATVDVEVVVVCRPGQSGWLLSILWHSSTNLAREAAASSGVCVFDGTVTVIDCGEPDKVVIALPAGSETEKDAAAVSVEVTAPPPAVAVEVAVIVQTVFEVWAIDEIAEMPAVSVKSVPAVVESDVQSSCSLPVTVNVIVADVAVAADEARVAVVGAVVSMTTERADESALTLPAASV